MLPLPLGAVLGAVDGGAAVNGEGSIYFEAATGRWPGAVVLPDGPRRRVPGRTKKDFRDSLRAVQLKVERGLPTGPGRLTVDPTAGQEQSRGPRRLCVVRT